MKRVGSNIALALAGVTFLAGGALAQASGGAMSSDSMSPSDHMSPAKTADHMDSGAKPMADHMAAHKTMAAHKKMKKSAKAKTDAMDAGAMSAAH